MKKNNFYIFIENQKLRSKTTNSLSEIENDLNLEFSLYNLNQEDLPAIKNKSGLFILSTDPNSRSIESFTINNNYDANSCRLFVLYNQKSIKDFLDLVDKKGEQFNNINNNFDYIIFNCDPKYYNWQDKKKEYNKFIFLGFDEDFDSNQYFDFRFDIRYQKFLKNLILFPDIKIKSSSGFPIKAMIEPVRACNLRCPSCPIGSGVASNFDKLTFDNFRIIIDKIYQTIEDISLFNYGEPLLHEDIDKMIYYAKKKGIKKVKIHTNGMLLDDNIGEKIIESGLDSLSISIDAASKESYDKYRVGGDFEQLVEKVKDFLRLRKRMKSGKPSVRAQFIIMSHNEHEVKKFYEMFKEIGVNKIRFKTFNAHMDGSDDHKNKQFLPLNKKYSRYSDNEAHIINNKFKSNICSWPWENVVINSNGDIAPCCYDYNADYKLGNIFDDDWWNNPSRNIFREKMENSPDEIEMCKYCAVGIPDLSYKKIEI